MICIVENEPLINHINEFDIILIGTNCYQVMRNGFQYEITKQFPIIKEINYQTKYGDINKVGTIEECYINENLTCVLCFISFGYNFRGNEELFVDYEALKKILKLINIKCKNKKIATTMLGCTEFDGNAEKNIILKIINDTLNNVNLTIFDYKQESGNTIKQRKYYNGRRRKKVN